MSLASQATSEHAAIAPSLALEADQGRIGRGLVVGEFGLIVVGLDKTAEFILQRIADRQPLHPDRLGGPFNHRASMPAPWPMSPREPTGTRRLVLPVASDLTARCGTRLVLRWRSA